MRVLNYTPHNINIYKAGLGGNELVCTLQSDGVARCSVNSSLTGSVMLANGQHSTTVDGVGFDLLKTEFGEVEGLPDEAEGTIIVVSMLVRAALPDRKDLYSPGPLLRDGNGQPIGCEGLTR